MKDSEEKKGILGWFASNHVAANLLMVLIIVAGLMGIFSAKMEVFPEFSLDMINVTVPYLGASPADVEEGVCLRVEEAIAGVEGVKRMTSSAAEGAGMTIVEVEEYADPTEVLDDIKAEIDTIITFPEETEKPIIAELKTRHKVITVVVYGDVSEKTLRILAEQVRNDLTAKPNISQVAIAGVRPKDIDISIKNDMLTIRGRREEQEKISKDEYVCQECYWGSFSRSIILPEEVYPDRITATFKNGILSINLPKVKRTKPVRSPGSLAVVN